MDTRCLANAASPSWTPSNRNVLMCALDSVLTRNGGYTGTENSTARSMIHCDLMETNAMHNYATPQRTMHNDALHMGSMHTNLMQSDPVRSESDAAHANSESCRSAM